MVDREDNRAISTTDNNAYTDGEFWNQHLNMTRQSNTDVLINEG